MPTFDIGFEHVSLSYATKDIFDDVTMGVNEGDRIGIVGHNGDGKSTLLHLLSGEQTPDSGRVSRRGGLTLGILNQTDDLDDSATVRQAALEGREDYEWAANPQSREIVETLLTGVSLESTVSSLSGGQRRRVDLARLLLHDWDILLLDEPTTHLDLAGIHWLARHLKNRWSSEAGALLVVTHDRWFLDDVCSHMWEVHDGGIDPFDGGYSAYIEQRVERDRQADVNETKRRNLARKELAWLTRGARARSTKQKFHVKAARELIADVPPVRNTLELKQMATSRLGKDVVELTDVSQIYPLQPGQEPGLGDDIVTVEVTRDRGEAGAQAEEARVADAEAADTQAAEEVTVTGKRVLNHVTWIIGPGDRFGIVGSNGVGKSTLLKIIDGSLRPTLGRVKIGKTVKFAVLSQRLDELEELGKYKVKEVLSRYKPTYLVDGKETTPGQLMERLGFSSAQLMTPIKDLSGGQKRRMQLLLILLDEPNVLIMDEPGNDLDTDMLAVMEDVLDSWPGTLIVVSHDSYLLERVTDQQFAIIDEQVQHLPGGVNDYFDLLDRGYVRPGSGQMSLSASVGAPTMTSSRNSLSSGSSNSSTSSTSAGPSEFSASGAASASSISGSNASSQTDSKETRMAKREAAKKSRSLERKLDRLNQDKDGLEAAMAAHDPSDFVGLNELNTQLQDLSRRIESMEEEWIQAQEIMEG